MNSVTVGKNSYEIIPDIGFSPIKRTNDLSECFERTTNFHPVMKSRHLIGSPVLRDSLRGVKIVCVILQQRPFRPITAFNA